MKPYLYPAVFLAAAIVLLSSGCAPRISTSIRRSLPPRDANAPVIVYGLEEKVPDAAETLGSVAIGDSGFTTDCGYEQVMQLAKAATNKIGGNGLKLTYHRKPNLLGSSCHRIGGNMLFIPDTPPAETFDTAEESPIIVRFDDETPLATPSADLSQTVVKRSDSEFHRTTLHLTPGYAFITSDYIVPSGFKGNFKQGLHLDAGIDHVSKLGLGMGLRYSGYFTSGSYGSEDFKTRIHYVAPEFAFRLHGQGKWEMNTAVGIGYARYSETAGKLSGSVGGLGMHLVVGGEYLLTPHIGICIQAGLYTTRFNKLNEIVQDAFDDDRHAGINLISFNGGLRFHF